MAWIEFTENFNTGHKEIDLQHRRIFNYVNSIYELNKSRGSSEIRKKLDTLIDYIFKHLEFEESLMQGNLDKYSDHIAEHQRFKNTIRELYDLYKDSDYTLTYEICKLIKNFYLDHIFFYDKILAKTI